LSSLGERAHHAAGRCGLDIHVQDILAHLQMEDLSQVVLVGHSYAGCVVSGVLAARPGRVAHAIYLDAFVPNHGQGLASFVPPPVKADFEELAAAEGLVPPPPPASWGERRSVSEPAMLAWAQARITPQAALSFTQTVQGDPFADSTKPAKSARAFSGQAMPSVTAPHLMSSRTSVPADASDARRCR